VCDVNLNLAVLGDIDQGTTDPITSTCSSRSRGFNQGDITVSNK
jgi:hypothetical protein